VEAAAVALAVIAEPRITVVSKVSAFAASGTILV
jgi:hypothetical protein